MFDNNDEFGLNSYNDDFNKLFETFKFLVKLIQTDKDAKDNLQGDFLGIQTQQFEDNVSNIFISAEETNPTKKWKREGHSDKGEITPNGICKKEIPLKNGDIIELLSNTSIGLEGQQFLVTPTKIAQFRMEGSFQQFQLKKI